MKAFHEIRHYDSDFMVWQSSYEDISFLAHWHQEIEFIYVRSGSAHLSINEHEFTAQAGDLVVVDSGDFHYSDSSRMQNHLDFIIFDPGILSSLYQYSHFIHPLISGRMLKEYGLADELKQLYKAVSTELDRKEPYYQDIVKAALRKFWYGLKRHHPRGDRKVQSQNKRFHMLYDMQQLLSYIETHYPENITLSFAAQKMGFSESYFSKIFKRLIGINFITYLNMIRVEKAAELLKNTGSKVIDVSFECGFNNVRSFNRTFKEITGYSPSQFMNLADPDSYNLTYYKRKSSDREFVENDSLTVIKNKP